MSFTLRKSHLRIFSAICSDVAVLFLAAIFATTNLLTLTLNIVAAILFLYLGVQAENYLEEYD
jgi:threonine/homoserine/homoserine lactone efflux protein